MQGSHVVYVQEQTAALKALSVVEHLQAYLVDSSFTTAADYYQPWK